MWVVRGVRIFYGGIMFKALIRRIVEAVRGATANEQERTDLSIRIPAGYLVACRRVHGQRKRHTPKRRRQRRDKADNADLRKQIAEINSEKEKMAEQHNKEIQALEEKLEVTKTERDRERADRVAAETDIQKLQEKNSNLAENLTGVSKELERRKRFPHLEFGPDAVRDYENLHPDVLPMVSRRGWRNSIHLPWNGALMVATCLNGGVMRDLRAIQCGAIQSSVISVCSGLFTARSGISCGILTVAN